MDDITGDQMAVQFDGRLHRRGVHRSVSQLQHVWHPSHDVTMEISIFDKIVRFNTIRISSLDHATLIIHHEKFIPKLAMFQLNSTTNVSI
jgi:hypothetical protein